MDNATGEIMCLVEVPATYKTVTKRVLKSPATTREVEIPAEYKTVRRQVMATPPTTRKVEIPAEYTTVKVQKLVTPPQTRTTPIPAEYSSVTKTVKTSDGHMEWRPILCQTNLDRSVVSSLQRALNAAGHDAGEVDGVLGRKTMEAIRSYQKSKGLAQGSLTLETLKSLGIRI